MTTTASAATQPHHLTRPVRRPSTTSQIAGPRPALVTFAAVALAGAFLTMVYRVLAVPGATSRDLAAQVRRAVSLGVDLALVVVGANDLTRLVPPAQAAAALGTAVTALRAAGARVIVAPAPDLSDFPAVPPAFRPLVHSACLQLQQSQAAATEAAGGVVAPVSAELARAFAADPALFSRDRFHPSSAGYARIADTLTPYVVTAARSHSAALQPEH